MQGAGGVGGLLGVTQDGGTYYVCSDANGNATEYVDTNGVIVAHREYDAFGNASVLSGAKRDDFLRWFSSKLLDHEAGGYDFGFRVYQPGQGRFMSRDPQEEAGGLNLLAFAGNDPINKIDFLGLSQWQWLPPIASQQPAQDDIIGQTSVVQWHGNVIVWDFGVCCKVSGKEGCGQVRYWYANSQGQSHELNHVNSFNSIWGAAGRAIDPYAGPQWMSCKKATCYQGLSQLIVDAYLTYAYAVNYDHDCSNYRAIGARPERIREACSKAQQYWASYSSQHDQVQRKYNSCRNTK